MRLHIPAFLNFKCLECGDCCRDYEMALSNENLRRLSRVDWRKISGDPPFGASGDPALEQPFTQSRGLWTGGPYRFKLRPSGACVFLRDDKKCLIHAHLGFEAKALACKLFPLTFAQTPSGVYVGCRFNCRAVAEAVGAALERDREAIAALCEEYRLSGYLGEFPEVVPFDGTQRLAWKDYLTTERAMIAIVLSPEMPLPRRATALWRIARLMQQAKLDKLEGAKFGEFMEIVSNNVLTELAQENPPAKRPDLMTRRLFQQFLFFLHRRRSGSQSLNWRERLAHRLEGLWTSIKFSFNFGRVRLFSDGPAVRLRAVDKVKLAALDARMTAVLERYIAAKLFGKQIFGPFFFGYNFVDGLTSLLCACSAVFWYARASALSRGAEIVEATDIMRAVQQVDYSFGYSPVPVLGTERLRIKFLGRGDAPETLVGWHSRCNV